MRVPRKTRLQLGIGVIAVAVVCPPATAGPEPGRADTDAQGLLEPTGRAMTRPLQLVLKESESPGRAVLRFLSPEDERGGSMRVIEREDQPGVCAAAPTEA